MEAKKFKNFSKEDFSWKFDGVPYTFPAGKEIYLEEDKAVHFCKHLVDRELNRHNVEKGLHGTPKEVPTSTPANRAPLEALCFPTEEVVAPAVALDLNETAKNKGGRPKKVVEEEFEDLKTV